MSIWGRKIFRKILRSRYNEQPKMAYDDFGDYGWKNTSEPSSSTQHIKLYRVHFIKKRGSSKWRFRLPDAVIWYY